jgi:hypothetical protein
MGASILGFHPYKEVILLNVDCVVVACHLKSRKIQYLGPLLGPNTYRLCTPPAW